MGIRKANNAGLVTTTAPGPDLCHTMPLVNPTTVVIRKIMWYNNTGAAVQLVFETIDNLGVAIPMLPTINCLNGFDGELMETELPEVEFLVDTRAVVATPGATGDIWVQATAAGVLVRLEVEEFREGR